MFNGRRLTVLIIPEEGGRTYEYKVRRAVLWLFAVGALGVFALLGAGLDVWIDAGQLARQVERLERDKAILTEEVELIEELEVMLRHLEGRNEQLRSITADAVGLKGGPPPERTGRAREQFISVVNRLRYGRLRTVPTMTPVRLSAWRPFGDGVLLEAPRGSLVRAAASGRVDQTGYDRDVGFTLTVDHGNGLQTRYAGIGTVIAEAGTFVQKGQPLGLTGLPRDGTTPGLRFAVIEDGHERTALFQRVWL